ncbi:helix-turn-helix domain-containing protein [Moorella sulfitireducens]|uniref:helix-turn-helix domain-containing protein n=1 Tax=Neomoorella sulfitireducens TaxID=2972948 RepID=UPI0021AD1D0A|nr:hypothetical protein [Moorella sulfitireducens]
MAYFFLITGAVLIALSALPALKMLVAGEGSQGLRPAKDNEPQDRERPGPPGNGEQLAGRLEALQEEVAALAARVEELAIPAASPGAFRSYLAAALEGEDAAGANPGLQGRPAGTPVETAGAGKPSVTGAEEPDVREQIRRAYAAGESIDSLARRFGRGKGEVALIINLKR